MASDLLGTLYKAMSGLNAFTQGLDNLSNNVANLNTNGYRANDLFYRELAGNQQFGASGDDGGLNADGQGVAVGGTKIRFVDGELAVTGNDTDIAIEGNGYFVLRDDSGAEFYTRAGEFIVDDEGFLIDPVTEYRVAKLDDSDKLQNINLQDRLVSDAEASDKVRLRGVLNRSATEGTLYPPADAADDERIEVKVFDDQGQDYTIFLQFTKRQDSQWRVDFLDENGVRVAENQLIEFGPNGAPTTDSLSKFINVNLFDLVAVEDVPERFKGVEEISIEDTPGEVENFGEIQLTLSEGQFIYRDDQDSGVLVYSESSKVEVDSEGRLVEVDSNRVLAARDPSEPGQLLDAVLALESARLDTQAIRVSGVLDAQLPPGQLFPPVVDGAQPDPITLAIFDSAGEEYEVTVSFTRIAGEAGTAEYELTFNWGRDDEFTASETIEYTLGQDGEWELQSDNPTATFTGTNAAGEPVTVEFEVKVDDELNPLRVESGVSQDVEAQALSGGETGLITTLEIDAEGRVRVGYSNGVVEDGPVLAVAERRGAGVEDLEMDFSAVNTAEFTLSDIQVEDINGRPTGQLTSFTIEADGTILLEYSNEDSAEDGRIALALFSNEAALQRRGDSLFIIEDTAQRVLGSGEDGAFGSLVHKSIERSNVEISREFAEIIIVQRGFQAASQILNVTNELIEELYNSTRGGR